MQLNPCPPVDANVDSAPDFIWSPGLIAAVAADMDRGRALLSQRRYDTAQRCWVLVVVRPAVKAVA